MICFFVSQPPGPSSLTEVEHDESEMEVETGPVDAEEEVEEEGWYGMFLEEANNDFESDAVMDNF